MNSEANQQEALIQEAAAFLASWRAHPNAQPPSDEECSNRLEAIRVQIAKTGTYVHTARELEFGARLAWKNSNRCIGRHLWKSLEVRDCRELHTEENKEERTIEALKSHMVDAFRDGKIKSVVSVFAPRIPGQPDPVRMANHQLIRYAGFDGAGDPDSLTITAHFLRVGWKPKEQGDFTPLPWQFFWDEWPGAVHDVFHHQPELIQEVHLTHPENPAFEALKLKWYALPVLSDLALKIGGIVYPFAPFNGYYMGTEIGARNLADTGRYNALEAVANCFDWDTSDDRTLWKDRALVELNRAVLHSFDQAGISIGDHHNLGANFESFCQHESGENRVVPGDWTWLNPPLSGPQTPQFHRDYDNTVCEHTNFFYQPTLWEEAKPSSGCPFHL